MEYRITDKEFSIAFWLKRNFSRAFFLYKNIMNIYCYLVLLVFIHILTKWEAQVIWNEVYSCTCKKSNISQ
jgi:hypothetical protein